MFERFPRAFSNCGGTGEEEREMEREGGRKGGGEEREKERERERERINIISTYMNTHVVKKLEMKVSLILRKHITIKNYF